MSCIEGNTGYVYKGKATWEETDTDISNINMPHTQVKYILGDPDKAYELAMLPNNGVGLLRLEFIINNSINVHPMALVKFNELTDETDK